ncbi:Hypothetical predicted protein [Paramuricea clavata]|uniref:Uncharacterized protein n=1 Tax=Paramuricea clavata TaxID=317549 RepID=A0A7D9LI78_PARCT|nr:Hypothetical predicted protein [Paramuricea clavata]
MTSQVTTVVTSQPGAAPRDWASGVFGCFEDIKSCLFGLCCPCCFMISLSQRMGEGCCFPICCPGALLAMRVKLRAENGIQGSMCNDALCVNFCSPCVSCQLARELDAIGR